MEVARIYYNAAKALGLRVVESSDYDGFTLSIGNSKYRFIESLTPLNNETSALFSANKYMSNKIMRENGIPVANSVRISKDSYTVELLHKVTSSLSFPVVVKPMSWTARGKDVICNVPNFKSMKVNIETLLKSHDDIVVEEFHGGMTVYRALVFNNKVIATISREPPYVMGNGLDTISSLIKVENKRRENSASFTENIEPNIEMDYCLNEQGLSLSAIPPKGTKVYLAHTVTTGRGATIVNSKVKICKENKGLLIKVARVLNLRLAGIDIICKDLSKPIVDTGGIIVEANYHPHTYLHAYDDMVAIKVMKYFIYKHPISYIYEKVIKAQDFNTFLRVTGVLLFIGIFCNPSIWAGAL